MWRAARSIGVLLVACNLEGCDALISSVLIKIIVALAGGLA